MRPGVRAGRRRYSCPVLVARVLPALRVPLMPARLPATVARRRRHRTTRRCRPLPSTRRGGLLGEHVSPRPSVAVPAGCVRRPRRPRPLPDASRRLPARVARDVGDVARGPPALIGAAPGDLARAAPRAAILLGRLVAARRSVARVTRTPRPRPCPWRAHAHATAWRADARRVSRSLRPAGSPSRCRWPAASCGPTRRPAGRRRRLAATRLEAVLLHELAHVRRRDCLTQALADATLALHCGEPAGLARGPRPAPRARAGLRRPRARVGHPAAEVRRTSHRSGTRHSPASAQCPRSRVAWRWPTDPNWRDDSWPFSMPRGRAARSPACTSTTAGLSRSASWRRFPHSISGSRHARRWQRCQPRRRSRAPSRSRPCRRHRDADSSARRCRATPPRRRARSAAAPGVRGDAPTPVRAAVARADAAARRARVARPRRSPRRSHASGAPDRQGCCPARPSHRRQSARLRIPGRRGADRGPRGHRCRRAPAGARTRSRASAIRRIVRRHDGVLGHTDPEMRRGAAIALSHIDDPRATKALAGLISDKDKEVRPQALFTLARQRDPAMVDPLSARVEGHRSGGAPAGGLRPRPAA